MVADSPDVGGAEATNDPEIFYRILERSYVVLIVGGAGANVLDPCRQVVNASHPLFFVLPGPEGLARVAESLWPASLLLQFALV